MAERQPVSPQQVADLIMEVENASLARVEQMAGEMAAEQPAVLNAIGTTTLFDSRGEVKDAIVHVVWVVFESLREELRSHGPITEEDVERYCEKNVAMWKFLDGEPKDTFTRSVRLTVASYPEPCLLAYMIHRLQALSPEDPVIMMGVKSILDACVEAKWGSPNKRQNNDA